MDIDINDDVEKDGSLEDALNTDGSAGTSNAIDITADAILPVNQEQSGIELTELITIRAESKSKEFWAELRVNTTWSEDGATFSWSAQEYMAKRNDRYGGGYLSCTSKSYTDYTLVTGRASQNGQWNPANGRGSVSGNSDYASIGFKFSYEIAAGFVETFESAGRVNYQPPPLLITPKSETDVREFEIQGTKAVSGAVLSIYNGRGEPIGTGTNNGNGTWKASVRIPQGERSLTLRAYQSVNGKVSVSSNEISVVLREIPVIPVNIESPKPNDVIHEYLPTITGTGQTSARIEIYEHTVGTVYGTGTVQSGRWSIKLTTPLPNRPLILVAGQTFAGVTTWSNQVYVTVKVAPITPVITSPAANSIQNPSFTLSGTGGEAGAIMQVFIDFTQTKVGEAPVTSGSWSVPVSVNPGSCTLAAEQIWNNQPSKRSEHRTFKIRPVQLAVAVTPLPNETRKFSGEGFTGATVEISKVSGPGGPPLTTATVVAGQWQATVSNWPPGVYTMSALQKVSDGAGGWIPSEPLQFAFTWELADPTDVALTVTNYTPTISGKGYTGATVVLLNDGGATSALPDATVVNGTWSSTATEPWGPTNKRNVHIRQGLNGYWSVSWVVQVVTIPPLAPAITEIIENGLSPTIKGTCWPGAVVNLAYSDVPATVHKPSVVSGNWTFRRETPFTPEVTHTVTVTQIAAEQISPPTSRTFTVHTPLHQPVITSPQPDEEVGRDLTIKGKDGVAGATMRLRDAQFDRPLGEPKLLTSDGDWSIELKGLAFRKYTADAIQAIGQRESLRSEYCFFEVVVLPPEIEVPTPGGDLPRTSVMSGRGLPGGRVEVWLQGDMQPLLRDIPINENGRWEGEVTLPVGAKTIRARQTFEQLTSKDSPLRTYNVVPGEPFIETPANGEPVGRQAVVSGFGYSGDTVKVMLADAPQTVLGQGPVLSDRTWSVPVTLDRSGGTHQLIAVQSRDGFDSRAAERPILLGSYLPAIDVPAQGRWVTDPVGFAGQGRPGTGELVSWFNPDRVLASGVPVTAPGWQHTVTQPLPAGGYRVRFKQAIQGETGGSDWAESERFEVAPLKPGSE